MFFWRYIESTRALMYNDEHLLCPVCPVILPPQGGAGAEECFVFWKDFHLSFFKCTCCCETEEVGGGSQAAVGEELHRSVRLPPALAWAGPTLLPEVLWTKCTEMLRTVFLSGVQSGFFLNMAGTQLLQHFDSINVFSFLLNAMESLYGAQREVCYICSILACWQS